MLWNIQEHNTRDSKHDIFRVFVLTTIFYMILQITCTIQRRRGCERRCASRLANCHDDQSCRTRSRMQTRARSAAVRPRQFPHRWPATSWINITVSIARPCPWVQTWAPIKSPGTRPRIVAWSRRTRRESATGTETCAAIRSKGCKRWTRCISSNAISTSLSRTKGARRLLPTAIRRISRLRRGRFADKNPLRITLILSTARNGIPIK